MSCHRLFLVSVLVSSLLGACAPDPDPDLIRDWDDTSEALEPEASSLDGFEEPEPVGSSTDVPVDDAPEVPSTDATSPTAVEPPMEPAVFDPRTLTAHTIWTRGDETKHVWLNLDGTALCRGWETPEVYVEWVPQGWYHYVTLGCYRDGALSGMFCVLDVLQRGAVVTGECADTYEAGWVDGKPVPPVVWSVAGISP